MASNSNLGTGNNLRQKAVRIISALIGLILLSAGLMKGTDMGFFVRQIEAYGIITHPFLIFAGAWGLIALECALGAGLIAGTRPRLMLSLSFLIFIVFLGATTYAWIAGTTDNCGCFGPWMKHSPREEALQNIVILSLTGLSLFWSRKNSERKGHLGMAAVAAGLVVGLVLPAATGLALPGKGVTDKRVKSLSVGNINIEGIEDVSTIEKGDFLVVLMGTDCSHCIESLPQMDTLSEREDVPNFLALCPNSEQEVEKFTDEFMPFFPLGRISEDDFWRLLGDGSTPRLLLVREGTVTQAWDGSIPNIDKVKISLKERDA